MRCSEPGHRALVRAGLVAELGTLATTVVSTVHIVLIVVSALIACPAIFLVIRDTRRGTGKWGISFRGRLCPTCGTPLPLIRRPANERQRLWGGGTCKKCGTEVDKWGVVVPAGSEDV